MAAAAVVVEGERDPVALRAAQILVSLRSRKLLERPEWLKMPAGEASSPGTAPAEVPERWARRRPRSGGRRGSPIPWRKALRLLDLAAATGSGAWPGGEERDAASARWLVEATLYYGAPTGSGSPWTTSADRAARTQPRQRHADEKAAVQAQVAKALSAAPAKEPMMASSPVTPLDYGAGGSGASSSADDAARPQAKRRGPGARASSADDDEGCSSPAKRARVAAGDEKPIPAEPIMQGETRASSGKVLAIDLNLPPPSDDDGGCPDAC